MNDLTELEPYFKRIVENGFRLTKCRKVILITIANALRSKSIKDETGTKEELDKTPLEKKGSFTADRLYSMVKERDPNIGLASVYRNLRLFEELGIIEKVGLEKDKVQYGFKRNNLVTSDHPSEIAITNRYPPGIEKEEDSYKRIASDYLSSQNLSYQCSQYYELKRLTEVAKFDNEFSRIENQLKRLISELKDIKTNINRRKESDLEEFVSNFVEVDKIIENYNCERGDLIQILLDVQKKYNWLPKHILFYISQKMNVPLTTIYSIASFYKFFNLEPRGKHSILVCVGTACHVRGSMNLLQRVVNVLGVKPGDTTKDYKFTLDTVNCLGCCAMGPIMMIDNKYYSNPPIEKLEKVLKEFD